MVNTLNMRGKGDSAVQYLTFFVTCVADNEVCQFEVICYWVLKSKHLQADVWTASGSWKVRSSPDLKNQTLISETPQSLGSKKISINIINTRHLSPCLLYNVSWIKTTMSVVLKNLGHMTRKQLRSSARKTTRKKSKQHHFLSPERTWTFSDDVMFSMSSSKLVVPTVTNTDFMTYRDTCKKSIVWKTSIADFEAHLKYHCCTPFIFLWAVLIYGFDDIPTDFLVTSFPPEDVDWWTRMPLIYGYTEQHSPFFICTKEMIALDII